MEYEHRSQVNRAKFIIGGLLIIAAILYLIISSTRASAQYFLTIEEVKNEGAQVVGRQLRISGAVIGETFVEKSTGINLSGVKKIPKQSWRLVSYYWSLDRNSVSRTYYM